MSIVAKVIAQSDEANRFLSSAELTKLQSFFDNGITRISAARKLEANQQKIVDEGSKRFWAQCSDTPSNRGLPEKTALCQRDQGWYIRLVSYCVLAGNSKPMEDIGLDGMRDMYVSLGVPLANLKIAMRCLKEIAMGTLTSEEGTLAAPYFEQLIRAF
ncbi:allophycocyanin [Synechococcus sp. CS-602]|uniref:allophycocyanin n=1 Tax=Synechococcaceae TaxID=1890426 RepID=UPI0008FF5154|nr:MULTISPECIES: allophycocyanin [Synechococcaceae]MCT4364023.1 allophycocyanin [Candidatus Regnicoccus frigidus MAG-AL1]APD47114.1 allophycocyanin [Synechococcus sp. SynAce01]MCT0204887.1 allophycocyanin [Synechococcus sp. CS-602]MCT0245843.1 allophycocyanin [Synechococcus sp. CS-601]MCT4368728.1 allophycocyanin [Candidatus Regnicoccus frigidus MAG-AL2]